MKELDEKETHFSAVIMFHAVEKSVQPAGPKAADHRLADKSTKKSMHLVAWRIAST